MRHPSATLAITCRWRSRPQHQERPSGLAQRIPVGVLLPHYGPGCKRQRRFGGRPDKLLAAAEVIESAAGPISISTSGAPINHFVMAITSR